MVVDAVEQERGSVGDAVDLRPPPPNQPRPPSAKWLPRSIRRLDLDRLLDDDETIIEWVDAKTGPRAPSFFVLYVAASAVTGQGAGGPWSWLKVSIVLVAVLAVVMACGGDRRHVVLRTDRRLVVVARPILFRRPPPSIVASFAADTALVTTTLRERVPNRAARLVAWLATFPFVYRLDLLDRPLWLSTYVRTDGVARRSAPNRPPTARPPWRPGDVIETAGPMAGPRA